MDWSKTGSFKTGGDSGRVRVKTQEGHPGLSQLETQQLTQAVSVSRTILPHVLGQLCWPQSGTKDARNARLSRYFLTGPGTPAPDELNTIYKTLELVKNGINAKINVKVAPDDDAYGYVGSKFGAAGALRGVFSPRHNLGTRDGKTVSRGDIHVDQDTLGDEDLMVITFIHEATHKYASAADHGKSGYLDNNGLTFDAPGLTKAQALKNADSYAWFCFAEYNNR